MMDKNQIAKFAAQDVFPSEEMTLAETALFYRLRDIYRNFHRGTIGKEQGEREKKIAVKKFLSDREKERSVERYLDYHAELYKRIESAAAAYKENKTIENSDKFVEAVYGVEMK